MAKKTPSVKSRYNKALKNYFKILRGAYTSSQFTPEDFEKVTQRTMFNRTDFQSVTIAESPTNRDLQRLLKKTEKLKEAKRQAKEYHGISKRVEARRIKFEAQKPKKRHVDRQIETPQTPSVSQSYILGQNMTRLLEELKQYLSGGIKVHELRQDMPEATQRAYGLINDIDDLKNDFSNMTQDELDEFYKSWSQSGFVPNIEVYGSDDNFIQNVQNIADWLLSIYSLEARSINKKRNDKRSREANYIADLDAIGFFD